MAMNIVTNDRKGHLEVDWPIYELETNQSIVHALVFHLNYGI